MNSTSNQTLTCSISNGDSFQIQPHAALEARDVWKIYGTRIEVAALQSVSLSIVQGEFVSIIGPSGSGKSTLMHILGCLDRPSKGEVYVDGVNVAQLSQDELAEIRAIKIGFVFQQFNLLPRKSAIKNAELPLVLRGYDGRKRRRRAAELLEKVGLGHRLNHKPSQLSGGEQQRVAIARALVGDPSLIIADEPTGNLDTRSSQEIMSLLKQLKDEGRTLVVVTHDLDVAQWADRSIRLRDGKVVNDES
jgi:putative ABC transport system ATP-binding protein